MYLLYKEDTSEFLYLCDANNNNVILFLENGNKKLSPLSISMGQLKVFFLKNNLVYLGAL